MQPGAGALADLWFDTDIALSTPSLSWILFRDADGDLAVGSGYVDLESVIYLGGVSYLQNNDGSFLYRCRTYDHQQCRCLRPWYFHAGRFGPHQVLKVPAKSDPVIITCLLC